VHTARPIEGAVVRAAPASFDDHFTQATMFYRSLTPIEQAHMVEAFTFELGKCYEQPIRERELQVLAEVDSSLCEKVAAGLGLPAPKGSPRREVTVSPALSQVATEPGPIAGRVIAVVADHGSDLAGIGKVVTAMTKQGATVHVLAPQGGELKRGRSTLKVTRTLLTARSIEFDAVLVADGTPMNRDIKLALLLQEAYRHCKPMGAWGSGADILSAAGVGSDAAGVLTAEKVGKAFTDAVSAHLGLHRVWERAPEVMASDVPPAS
jgi:catalase